MTSSFIRAAALAAMCILSNIANAGVIYTYTGNTFTNTVGSTITTTDSVTVTINLDNVLLGDLTDSSVLGLAGFTMEMCSAGTCLNDSSVSFINADVSTNNLGNIERWDLIIIGFDFLIETFMDNIDPYDSFQDFSTAESRDGFVVSNPGTWALVTQPGPVPGPGPVPVSAPSTMMLFSLACVGLVFRRMKKKGYNQRG